MDAWSPLYEEVLLWAQGDNDVPEQDWDLSLTINFSVHEFDSLIAEPTITEPARMFLVGCLYVLVGDAVRTEDREAINSILCFCNSHAQDNQYLKLWAHRSVSLISNPENYEYAYWGDNPSLFAKEGGL